MTPVITLFLHRLIDPLAHERTPADTPPPEDLARVSRFHFAADRRRWLAGRTWIRRTLGSLLNQRPADLAFSLGPNGKPRVLDAPPGFECNWSHSRDWLALAVCHCAPVGVDIEAHHDDFPALEVARQFFTPTETAALQQTEGSERQNLFLRLWTAKEALMKATGAGVMLPPDQIDVSLAKSIPTGYATHPGWQLACREAEGWAAAVAWPARVECVVEMILA